MLTTLSNINSEQELKVLLKSIKSITFLTLLHLCTGFPFLGSSIFSVHSKSYEKYNNLIKSIVKKLIL